MFNAAASLLAVTLAISTTVSAASDVRGISIPLRQSRRRINMHSQNPKNLVNNIGTISLPKGAVIKSRATISRDVEEHLQRRQAETLTDVNGDEPWAGSISIGTPARSAVSGSSDLWVPTAKQQTETFQIQYGDDSEVSGPVFTDTVSVAGVKATNQHFSHATTVTGSFGDGGVDGILGMTYGPSISY
ncbi:aspartic peptidase domain-containing protein [Mycena albidolilacea]|uniref:Aspartic peptidase domain-containing protein n=1 Tax=Mycena albidolilacea TaxID=1033008 RepID=A0AAD7AAZ1_9AGAR|nr:aspartic peptidase domain-containing protein [Mycena albidolilacea]